MRHDKGKEKKNRNWKRSPEKHQYQHRTTDGEEKWGRVAKKEARGRIGPGPKITGRPLPGRGKKVA